MDQICARDSMNRTIIVIDNYESGYEPVMKKWLAKFIEKARNLAQIAHQDVVTVFEIWPEKWIIYYVMKYIEGGELPSSIDPNWAKTLERSSINNKPNGE